MGDREELKGRGRELEERGLKRRGLEGRGWRGWMGGEFEKS